MIKKGDPTVLGTERIRKLLPNYTLPSIIAMTAVSLYNVVDSIFIGQGCGPLAIAGLAVSFPLMNLSAAFGAMVGVGSSTVIGVKMGQKDYAGAESVLGHVVMLNVAIGALFMIACLTFLDPILMFFGASEETLPYAHDYMQTLLYGNILTHLYLGLNDAIRATGYPKRAMMATLTAVVINILFNYIFILKMNLGIKGAAMGTLCAQFVAFSMNVFHFSRKSTFLRFKRRVFRLRRHYTKSVLGIGMSSFFANSCACLVVLLINNGLKNYGGDLYVGAYGISNRIAMIFVMIVMGLNQGAQPIISYNYGAGNFERFIKTFKLGAMVATAITTCAFLVGEFCPRVVVKLFTTDEELIEYSCRALRIMVCVFPLVGFQMMSIGFFTTIGKAKKAIFLSLTRQLVFLVPLLIFIPMFMGTDGVWISMPISDFISVLTTGALVYLQIRTFKRHPETLQPKL
ncbi:MAG: MATE family efflux transporter [Bacteroidia bacterium]|nr:MATE family efflux transporter [Bacteroidia bacterium]